MDKLLSAPHLFAVSVYASIIFLVLLLIFTVVKHRGYRNKSAIALGVSLGTMAIILIFGDWKIPNCDEAHGALRTLPQCQFP